MMKLANSDTPAGLRASTWSAITKGQRRETGRGGGGEGLGNVGVVFEMFYRASEGGGSEGRMGNGVERAQGRKKVSENWGEERK